MNARADMAVRPRRRLREPVEDRILYAVVDVIMVVMIALTLYPVIFVVSASFSSGSALQAGKVLLWPVEWNIRGYQVVFSNASVLLGYRNTFFYTAAGTLINLAATMAFAYPMSRADFPMRRGFMVLATIPMFFSGGLIPSYILIVQLKLINTIWAVLIPGAVSTWNMVLMRTFMQTGVPKELLDASQIDGCTDAGYFVKILLPLSKPIIAVIALYNAVGIWNSYFNAMLYLNDSDLWPLQIVLRNILVVNDLGAADIKDLRMREEMLEISSIMKYALIVVSTAPIMAFYPLVQKHFMKGVMLGSLKG